MKTFLQNRKRVFFALGLIFFLLCWVLISKLIASDLIFPGPMPVFRKLIELVRTGELFVPLMKTFVKALLGMLLALGVGLVSGFIMGSSPYFYELVKPLAMALRSVPIVSWLSTVILLWGIGWKGPTFIVFISLLPLIMFNVAEGVRSVDSKLLEVARVYEVSKWRVFKDVYLGSVLPFLLSSIDVSIGVMWKSAIVAEYLVGDSGLGVQISWSKFYIDTPRVFAYTITAVVCGLTLEGVFSLMQRRVYSTWRM